MNYRTGVSDYGVAAVSTADHYVPPETLLIAHNVLPTGFARVTHFVRFTLRGVIGWVEELVYYVSVRRTSAGELHVETNEATQPRRSVYIDLRLYAH